MKKLIETLGRLTAFVGLLFGAAEAPAKIPRAYSLVAEKYRVPAAIFYSMILQESGLTRLGRFHPWPWTLNVDHRPYRFESRREAESALQHFLSGHHKIAVGLGQIYLPAHGHRFPNPARLLEPRLNLEYAAHLLATEYQWTSRNGGGNWWTAVGRYHAPSNAEAANTYRKQVYQRCLKLALPCDLYGIAI